ncbi:MAG: peptidase M15 [Betaproteobacteria bacterium]|nr:peptidase M15 [Betaproteobacteria bacterium]
MTKRLSRHFTLDELVASQTAARRGIDNTPSPAVVRNLRRLAALLEKVRTLLGGKPILVSSGYRCRALNAAVAGAKASAHMAGLAADFTAPGYGTVLQVARRIAASSLRYDQLIHEYGAWVHIGLAPARRKPRRQNLSIFKGTGYLDGIVALDPRANA